MSANVKVVTYPEPFKTYAKNYRDKFLVGSGILVSNAGANNWNVRTGRGKNSVTYITSDGKTSGFGTAPGRPEYGKAEPLTGINALNKPKRPNTVKIGSALIYARFHEKKVAWLSRAIDITIAAIKALAIRLKGEFK